MEQAEARCCMGVPTVLTTTPDMEMEVFMGGSPFMGVAVRMNIEPKGCANGHPTHHQQ